MTLKELFSDWVEPDHAHYYLACLLGLMEYDDSFAVFLKVKSVFNTKNEMGTMLFEMMEKLVEGGVLECNESIQYRWNKSFNEYWNSYGKLMN